MDYFTGDPETDAYIKERYESLPELLRTKIVDLSAEITIEKMCRQYGLSVGDTEFIKGEVILVLMGFESLNNLSQNIHGVLPDLSEEEASNVAKTLTTQIFLPLEKDLVLVEKLFLTEPEDETAETVGETEGKVTPAPEKTQTAPKPETPYGTSSSSLPPIRKPSYNAILDVPKYDMPHTNLQEVRPHEEKKPPQST